MSDETKRSLVRKLSEVMAAVSHVPKSGRNNFHNYDYATEADITASVRQEMARRNVMLIPSVEACDFLEVATNAGKKERLCTMRMVFSAHDGDSGEVISFTAVGQGQDGSDKAAYKAATGATKYALLKLFLIPTGDDPEADSKPAPAQKPTAKAAPLPSKPKAIDTSKLVAAFAAVGIPVGRLEDRISKPLAEATEADVAALRTYHATLKATPAQPTEAQRAEAGIAAEAEKKAAPSKEGARNAAFAALTARISAATTPELATHIASEAASETLFGQGELKAIARAVENRVLILKDAISEAKRPKHAHVEDLTQ